MAVPKLVAGYRGSQSEMGKANFISALSSQLKHISKDVLAMEMENVSLFYYLVDLAVNVSQNEFKQVSLSLQSLTFLINYLCQNSTGFSASCCEFETANFSCRYFFDFKGFHRNAGKF